jgi:pimeloyl-ACP methyl ester carboxylesterase
VRTEVILQHGWALDSQVWSSWLPWLQAHGIEFQLGERGYFGLPERAPSFGAGAEYRIIVAHSLGLHLLNETAWQQADAIMAINSFLRFHPDEPKQEKRSRRVIKAMLDKMSDAPYAVLKQFIENCYYPESSHLPLGWCAGVPILDVPRLTADLQLLDEHILSPSLLNGKTVVNIQGTHDKIVPPGAAAAFTEALPNAATYRLGGCGHAAPMMQAHKCLLLLSELISSRFHPRHHVSSTNS